MSERRRSPVALRVGYCLCVLIAMAAVIRRLVILAHPPATSRPELGALDGVFSSHAGLTMAHIVPALVFVALTPLVLFRVAARWRWPERLLYPLGLVVGLTAFAMSQEAVGGWTERSAVWFFNSLFLVSLFQAMRHARVGDPTGERRWLLRAIVILLGIATTRPVMGLFFATRAFTHLAPSQFFGLAFWIGFSINALTAEWWLATQRRAV